MKYTTLIIAIMILLPLNSFADSSAIAGKIQGASYIFNKTVQPTGPDDPKAALEREFVLQTSDGKIYFLPNVPREMKVKAVNKEVRVYGDATKDGVIFVHQIMVKFGNEFVTLCDWDKKMKEQNAN